MRDMIILHIVDLYAQSSIRRIFKNSIDVEKINQYNLKSI